ncbi:plp-dependent transferase [Phaffia rhodozyma]|uniref:alanine--glyoxylate transaminase n=1 Tax=Phaffia rhodozyma TaxID=264483 RepID=A0A0F7SGW7_PHARH|nr:plp-dependent transferase [Phaffia rhodozyma]
MSNSSFKQEEHKLLVIPGPIEVSDDVLLANAHPSMSHVSPAFAPVFGDCIRMTREVVFTKDAQPFLIAGSGTLGWDLVAANLVEQGEDVLVLNSGYFGDSFADCLEAYGAQVTQIGAPVGGAPTKEEITKSLRSKKFKLLTFTHVDTSTGVLSDAKMIAETVKEVSPDTLVVLDGVCSVASEEIQMDAWGIDVVIGASQKGLGVPPGLSVSLASQKALEVFKSRKTRVSAYYASWAKWLPVMKSYETPPATYFATPPVQLIYAFHASLSAITKASPSLPERFAAHKAASKKIKDTLEEWGLGFIPLSRDASANGMTAAKFPAGLKAPDLLPKLLAKGVVMAAGLHKEVKDMYFRIGHMGITVTDPTRGDVDTILKALKESLTEAGLEPPPSMAEAVLELKVVL